MSTYNLSKIVDANGNSWDIKAKALEAQKSFALTGDVTGTSSSDLSNGVSVDVTIGNNKVTTSKINDSAVTNEKIADSTITQAKLASSVYSGAVSDNDSKLATHAAVKTAIDTAISGQGAYLGKQTVATINTWIASNLNNGDRCIASDSGTVTLGNISVRAGEDLIFWKTDDTAVWQSMDGEFKIKQNAVSDPSASGTTLTAIATISQDTNGNITATKKTIQDATNAQKGVVQIGTGLSVSSGTVSVSYGTTANTACAGNDARLSDDRYPLDHEHGYINSDGSMTAYLAQTPETGDDLIFASMNGGKLHRSRGMSFDTEDTTKFLRHDGTFAAPPSLSPSSTTPKMDGVATVGTETAYARGDHKHPSDSSKENTFTINYRSSDNALIFSKAFGTTT